MIHMSDNQTLNTVCTMESKHDSVIKRKSEKGSVNLNDLGPVRSAKLSDPRFGSKEDNP